MYVVRYDGLDNPGGGIVLVLGKAESELKVVFFLTNIGVSVYAVNLAAESEEGEFAGSIIDFL